jgi:hypothetical protein
MIQDQSTPRAMTKNIPPRAPGVRVRFKVNRIGSAKDIELLLFFGNNTDEK